MIWLKSFLFKYLYEMADDYIFLNTGYAMETNPVIQVQYGEEMMEVKELVENTSGNSEHKENV